MVKPVTGPRQAAAELRSHVAAGEATGILFGCERTGLENDDVALADTVITVPLNPQFHSLNLAQAVLVIAYEWSMANETPVPLPDMNKRSSLPAQRGDLVRFFHHLERELDECGFFRVAEKKPSMVRQHP